MRSDQAVFVSSWKAAIFGSVIQRSYKQAAQFSFTEPHI